jgi:hypothetical protein
LSTAWQRIEGAQAIFDEFGEWPSFHDAEVVRLELSREAKAPALLLTIKYSAGAHRRLSGDRVFRFAFASIADVELFDFNEQNVLAQLTLMDAGSGRGAATLHSLYGVRGKFTYASAVVSGP